MLENSYHKFEINLNLLKEASKQANSTEILEQTDKIISKFEKLKLLHKKKGECRGKILIDKQIKEEMRRKVFEVIDGREGSIQNMHENKQEKEEFIFEYIAKFKEVDAFLEDKIKSKQNKTEKEERLSTFKMKNFLLRNNEDSKYKEELLEEIDKIRYDTDKLRIDGTRREIQREEFKIKASNVEDLLWKAEKKVKEAQGEKARLKKILAELKEKSNSILHSNIEKKQAIKEGIKEEPEIEVKNPKLHKQLYDIGADETILKDGFDVTVLDGKTIDISIINRNWEVSMIKPFK